MSAGKGDTYRPVDKRKYDLHFDQIDWSKWLVYLLECSDGSLYCGITKDLEGRVKAHNSGKGAKYTASRRPVKLVYTEVFGGKSEALKREHEIKKLSRNQKLCLISGYNLREDSDMETATD